MFKIDARRSGDRPSALPRSIASLRRLRRRVSPVLCEWQKTWARLTQFLPSRYLVGDYKGEVTQYQLVLRVELERERVALVADLCRSGTQSPSAKRRTRAETCIVYSQTVPRIAAVDMATSHPSKERLRSCEPAENREPRSVRVRDDEVRKEAHAASGPPTMKLSVPFSAPTTPPLTGASTISAPTCLISFATSFATA